MTLTLRRAFAANFAPALFLWSAAAILLTLYYFAAPVQNSLNQLASLKANWGLGFSMPAQAIAAGLLPFFFQKWQRGSHQKTRANQVPFLMLFWAFQGALTDLFYSFQARIFGDNAQLLTVALKTAADMLVVTPLVFIPLVTLAFTIKNNEFSFARIRADLSNQWIAHRVVPVYLACLLVWTPTVLLLYQLPLALQFPFQAIIQCFWGLILAVLTVEL